MSYDGYMEWSGNEFVNVARTEAYARNAGMSGFVPTFKNDSLHLAVGDDAYRSPLQDDDCPWVDPLEPDSYGFFGAYPMQIDGIDSSTRTSVITEYLGDGGSPGRLRNTTKSVVFSLLLLGHDDAAVDFGMGWLRALTLSGAGNDCYGENGARLNYFSAEPKVDGLDPQEALDCSTSMVRVLNRVVCTSGPSVTQRMKLSDGTSAWAVQMTVTCGDPFQYGEGVKVLKAWPRKTGVYADNADPAPIAPGVTVDPVGHLVPNQDCPTATFNPFVDPNCVTLEPPPAAPSVGVGCYSPPVSWRRRSVRIPRTFTRRWTDMVPTIRVINPPIFNPLENVRLRFYTDPIGTLNPDVHDCDYCGDFVITYLPRNSTLVIDGVSETITLEQPGQVRKADGLVLSSRGTPFSWPALSCESGYLLTLDCPNTQGVPQLDVFLTPKVR